MQNSGKQNAGPSKNKMLRLLPPPMFTINSAIALFTVAKIWKNSKYFSTSKWIKKIWLHIPWNSIKSWEKKRQPVICLNMDGTWGNHGKRSQRGKDKNYVKSLKCGILKKTQNRKENELIEAENRLLVCQMPGLESGCNR